jgi:ubiquinone/menaquinone biosynthesis C-methylase UbiE
VSAVGAKRWFFDAWSRIYDTRLIQRATYRPVHDAVVAALQAHPPRRVLDLGCGTGQLAERIAAALPRVRIVGCDFSAGMLAAARARVRRAAWAQADAGWLPFASERFGAIVSTEAFHWFPDQPRALRECFRVLEPGGRLLIAFVNTPSALLSHALYVTSRAVGEPFYWPTHRHMRTMVEGAGFIIERRRPVFRLPGFLLPPVLTCARRPER